MKDHESMKSKRETDDVIPPAPEVESKETEPQKDSQDVSPSAPDLDKSSEMIDLSKVLDEALEDTNNDEASAPIEPEKVDSKYDVHLQMLASMGFVDNKADLLALIEKYNGNMQEIVTALLTQTN